MHRVRTIFLRPAQNFNNQQSCSLVARLRCSSGRAFSWIQSHVGCRVFRIFASRAKMGVGYMPPKCSKALGHLPVRTPRDLATTKIGVPR